MLLAPCVHFGTMQVSELPVLHAPCRLTDTFQRLTSYTAKLNPLDTKRTELAVGHVKSHIDFDRLLGHV